MNSEAQPILFDLTRSQLGTQSGPSTMQVIDDRTSVLFGVELAQLLQEPVDLEVDDTGASKFVEYLGTLETPGCYCQLEMEALGGHAMVGLERSLVFRLLERLLGGNGAQKAREAEDRQRFSLIEERIIRKLVRLFGRALEEAWRPIVPLKTRHGRIETRPTNLVIAQPQDWVTHTTFRITLGGESGWVQCAMPATLLGAHRKRLNLGTYEEGTRTDGSWRDPLTSLLQEVAVEVIGELGKAHRPFREVLQLQVGDVIRLDQPADQPVTVSVQRIPKYRGEITVHHGNLAVALTSLHHLSSPTPTKESHHES